MAFAKKGGFDLGLMDYWAILLKRKWSILIIALLAMAAGAMRVSSTRPVYQATVQVLIERQNPRVLSFEDVAAAPSPFEPQRDYYETQFRILESRSLVRDVIEEEGLRDSLEFQPLPPQGFGVFVKERLRAYSATPPIQGFLKWTRGIWQRSGAAALWASLRSSAQAPVSPEVPPQEGLEGASDTDHLVDGYLSKLNIEPVKDSRLVKIQYEGFHPAIIAAIANAHAEGYIRQSLNLRTSTSLAAADWLNAQLVEVRNTLRGSEQTLLDYMEQNELVTLSERQGTTEERLQNLNTSFTEARASRIELEGLYQQIADAQGNASQLDSLPTIAGNVVIQNLRRELLETEADLARLSQRYKEGHPQIVSLRRRMDLVSQRLDEERDTLIGGVELQLDIARARENAFSAALEAQNREAIADNKKTTQFDILSREVETNRELYDTLLGRLKEINLTGGLQVTNIRIMDRAEIPVSPIRPNGRLTLTMSLLLGLMFGFGVTLLREQLDTQIRLPGDVERYLDVPFLGYLGRLDKRRGSDLIALSEPKSPHAEAVKTIRTNILYSPGGRSAQVLAITSPNPEEGKTLMAANLAISMAQAGRRVLLIDADMRKPRIHRAFHMKNKMGLKDVLEGRMTLGNATQSGVIPISLSSRQGLLPRTRLSF